VSHATPHDWDATSYEQVSTPQQAWGREVLDRLELRGDETVLDAGCGTGQVTAMLLGGVPDGRVIGVDGSPAMIEKARERFGDRVELHVQDLRELELTGPVDVIISTATLHWIPEQPRVWERFHSVLAPGGRLEVQFGGHGNVAEAEAAMAKLAESPHFAAALSPWRSPWRFPTAGEARTEAEAAGFTVRDAWLARRDARPADVRAFLATSVVTQELEKLPDDLREPYLDELMRELSDPDFIPYVRVNLSARA
jgi:trans-aconitate 2-methyltransferase